MTPPTHPRPGLPPAATAPAAGCWLSVSTPEWRWQISPRLSGAGSPVAHWLDLIVAPHAEVRGGVVKEGPHRVTRRVVVAGVACYLKQDRCRNWSNRLRNLLCGSAAKREFRKLRLLGEAGVPVVEPLAVGQPARWWENGSWLLTAEAGGVPLDDLAPPERRPADERLTRRQRVRLIEALARLLAQFHAAGFFHRDLHAGNILWEPAEHEDDLPRLTFVDVAAVESCMGQLPDSRRWHNLVQLRHSFCLATTRSEQLRFARSYLQEALLISSPQDRLRYRRIVRELTALAAAYSKTAWARADRKWARGNRRMVRIERETCEVRGLARLGRSRLEQLANANGESAGQSPEGWRWMKLSHARRVWELGHFLLRRGVRVAEPVVMVQPNGSEIGWVAFEPRESTADSRPASADAQKFVESLRKWGHTIPSAWREEFGERQSERLALSPSGLAWLGQAAIANTPQPQRGRAAA